MEVLGILISGTLAGVLGALVMNLFFRWVSSSFEEPVNMVKVIGSYFSGSNKNSLRTGSLFHLLFGAVFGIIYCYALVVMHAAQFPVALFTGFGFGFAHGLIVAYGLMFFVGEKHPINRYRKSTFSVGVLYLMSHVIYGGTVGLLISILNLIP